MVVCTPPCHLEDARQLNWAASGAPFSTSRASSSACTLTPLSATVVMSRDPLSLPAPRFPMRLIDNTPTRASYHSPYGRVRLDARGRLGRCRRNQVPRLADAGAARLRAGAAPGPRRLRDVRDPVAPAG